MRGLIGLGERKRREAQQGFAAGAKLEQNYKAQADALEAAERAQDAAMLGQGAGIGSMYGLNKSYGAQKLAGEKLTSANDIFSGVGEFTHTKGGLTNFTPSGGETIEGIKSFADIPQESLLQIEIGSGASGASGAAEAAATVTEAAGTEALVAAEAATAEVVGAGASQSLGSTLAGLATPIGIGLAVASLLQMFK
tara:strand:- start:19 stop:603 length:585 start_codon:yes stop_codon:yes gene_type:complete